MARWSRTSAEPQLPFPEEVPAWETHGIFSEHFIRSRLKSAPFWPSDETARPIYDFISELWKRRYVGLTRGGEPITRQEFLDKVLPRLGFAFLSNLHLPVSERRQEPDYLLFADERTKEEVFNADRLTQYQAAIGLMEAKMAAHPLDTASKKETPGRFPHQQVRGYLDAAADQVGQSFFRWAILTNGGVWRLYCRDAHPSAYFQFNLAGRPPSFCSYENFKVFLTLFQSSVFVSQDGICPLDEVRREAVQYQAELEGNLRKRIFAVLTDLANGFWGYRANGLTADDLTALYDNCLIFLYRLLFVLYAESRGLLPVRPSGAGSNRNYRERYSLQRLVPHLKRASQYQSDDFTKLHEELLELFHLINGDQPARNRACAVPRYNGGLFNHKEHPRLDQWRIGEKSLAGVLRDLIFSGVPTGRKGQVEFDWGTIDYADLEVRQLGDIYEGLLGGHLEVENGRLALRGERAALQTTGTFYTPDFIVCYLVEETLGPLIQEIEATEPVQAAKKAGRKDNSFALAVLKLNILDPAMGSGHFLVRATEWLAYKIVDHSTTEFQVKEVPPGLSQERAEIAYWRRRVVESCIYGVDYNPLAVELAKLSLWLTCISSDEPLSFLDHHLRPGNSLIGARLSELGGLPRENGKQVPISFGPDLARAVGFAIREISAIEGQASTDLETLKRKESRWRDEVLPRLEPYKKASDLWTATLAGLKLAEATYIQLAEGTTQPPTARTGEAKRLQKELAGMQPELDRIRNAVKPFHWELEFPDVFLNEDGSPKANPGFDAILGNPPYISTQTSSDLAYRNALQHRLGFVDDLYVHFVFRGFELLRTGGGFGFIVSDTFFTLSTKQRLRELLQSYRLTHLGQCDPFAATVDAAVFVAQKVPCRPQEEMLFVQARYGAETSKPESEFFNLINKGLPTFAAGVTPFIRAGDRFPVRHGAQGCLRLHQTAVEPYRRALKRAFFEPAEGVVRLYNRLMDSVTQLVVAWWGKIETSKKFAQNRQTILAYHRTLKPGDVTLAGLIAEGGQGMRTANNGRFLGYLDGTEQAEKIRQRRQELIRHWESHPKVGAVFRQIYKETGRDFEAVVEPLKERFDQTRDLGLKKGELYQIVVPGRVANIEAWTDQKRREAISYGLEGKAVWVPYRKGDPEGNKWTDNEPLFICWTKENVKHLSTSPDARWQGQEFFFQPGVTWTLLGNHVALKAKLQPPCVFDAGASRLTPCCTSLSVLAFLAILNSNLFSFVVKKFLKNTQDYEVNDLRTAPLVIPTGEEAIELEGLARRAVDAKELALKGGDPPSELIAFCRQLALEQEKAPPYLRPSPQIRLLHTAADCLTAIELAVNWAVERLYGVEGLGPFDEF